MATYEFNDKINFMLPAGFIFSRDEDDGETDKKEYPQFEKVIEYIKEHNAQKYFGMLDEEFVPHVDAFWYGLQAHYFK